MEILTWFGDSNQENISIIFINILNLFTTGAQWQYKVLYSHVPSKKSAPLLIVKLHGENYIQETYRSHESKLIIIWNQTLGHIRSMNQNMSGSNEELLWTWSIVKYISNSIHLTIVGRDSDMEYTHVFSGKMIRTSCNVHWVNLLTSEDNISCLDYQVSSVLAGLSKWLRFLVDAYT